MPTNSPNHEVSSLSPTSTSGNVSVGIVSFTTTATNNAASSVTSSESISNNNKFYSNGNKRQRRANNSFSLLKSSQVYHISPYSHLRHIADSTQTYALLARMVNKRPLNAWGFPEQILLHYQQKGIAEFFPWQVECLDRPGVLQKARNLVYSAPTSAGKTMVADVLLYKTLMERKKKGIIILPFVSIAVEKVNSLKQVLRKIGVRIDSFAGNVNPRGGLARVDVAVCTIEKANNMINRLIEEDKLSEIGIIVVDELHMLGDSSRGYLLELLLSKLLYVRKCASASQAGVNPFQIVGMSATIPNLPQIAQWLDAELYVTNYRPVPLYQKIVRGDEVFRFDDSASGPSPSQNDQSQDLKSECIIELISLSIKSEDAPLIYCAIETLMNGHSALVFCPTKAGCEKMARTVAENIFEFGAGRKLPPTQRIVQIGKRLKESIDANKVQTLMTSLRQTALGIDKNLEVTLRFGVAFHHAGLSIEERSLIERGFRDGAIRVLCSTTTLSAGVNLPARRVLISSPFDYRGALLDVTCYRQMIGRAGRAGIDQLGEAMLFCKEKDFNRALNQLVRANLSPIKSCLLSYNSPYGINSQGSQPNTPLPATPLLSPQEIHLEMSDSLKRAILEVIANGTAPKREDVCTYVECTFFQTSFSHSQHGPPNMSSAIDQVFDYLITNQLIYLSKDDPSKLLISPLGKAIVASGVSPDDGQFLQKELDKARQNLSLVNDLHLIYQVTPTYVAEQLDAIDWGHFLHLWTKMSPKDQTVAQLVGVRESYLVTKVSTFQVAPNKKNIALRESLLIHQRFYASLALHDLVQEMPLTHVASKYRLSKGLIQSLQQQAATFAGMLTTFCAKLGWNSLELLIDQFQPRLTFGIQRDLIDLMRIPCLTSTLARQLHQKGYENLLSLIHCKESDIEEAIITSNSFEKLAPNTNKKHSNEAKPDQSTDPGESKLFIPNLDRYITVQQLSELILQEARNMVEREVGLKLNYIEAEQQQQESMILSQISSPTELISKKLSSTDLDTSHLAKKTTFSNGSQNGSAMHSYSSQDSLMSVELVDQQLSSSSSNEAMAISQEESTFNKLNSKSSSSAMSHSHNMPL